LRLKIGRQKLKGALFLLTRLIFGNTRLPHSLFRWTHFEECVADDEVVASTNSSEGINSTLNEGFRYAESLAHQISHVKKFKINQIERFNEIISNRNWVPGRRPATIERHERLSSMVNEFMNLGVVNQHDMLIEFAMNIGRLMSKTHPKKKK